MLDFLLVCVGLPPIYVFYSKFFFSLRRFFIPNFYFSCWNSLPFIVVSSYQMKSYLKFSVGFPFHYVGLVFSTCFLFREACWWATKVVSYVSPAYYADICTGAPIFFDLLIGMWVVHLKYYSWSRISIYSAHVLVGFFFITSYKRM